MLLPLPVMARTPLARFVLAVFFLASLVNLAANLFCPSETWLVFPSKVVLMPSLTVLLYVCTRGQRSDLPLPLIYIALGLSWVGDIVLGLPTKDVSLTQDLFVAGMVAFGLAHVFFSRAFLHGVDPRRLGLGRILLTCLPFAVYGYTLYSLIYINMAGGDVKLRLPVLVYMVLLLSTAICSVLRQVQFDSPSALLIFVGALLLVQSDSVLAIKQFVEPLPIEDFAIMATYILGQYLIVNGCVPVTGAVAVMPERSNSTLHAA